MSYRAPPPVDAGKALATKAVSTAISYIPIVGPVLSSFAGPIVDVISGIGTDQRKLFEDWERSYVATVMRSGGFNTRTEPVHVTAARLNRARGASRRVLTQILAYLKTRKGKR